MSANEVDEAGPRPGSVLVLQSGIHLDDPVLDSLKAHGLNLELVSSLAAALRVMESENVDLVLLDTVRADADGIALCRHLMSDPRAWGLPIIFLNDEMDAGKAGHALNVGAVDFVSVPCKIDELVARIRTHLELKRTRDELQLIIEQEKETLTAIAHELKSPLTAIQTAGVLLRNSGISGDEPRAELVDSILESCTQSLQLINERLERSTAEYGAFRVRPAAMDLVDAAQQVVEQNQPTARAKAIRLRIDCPEAESVEIWADYQAVCEVIDNLVTNAIKYSPPGKSVGIEVRANLQGRMPGVSVIDEGPGLSAEDRSKLFRPFQKLSAAPTAGESSHGLGLSIAAKLVGKMKGRIGCESQPGEGATFWVSFPAVSPASTDT